MTAPTQATAAGRAARDEIAAKRRRDVLKLIRTSIAKRGYPPTTRELARDTGTGSTLTIRRDLSILVDEGRIEVDTGEARGIRLV